MLDKISSFPLPCPLLGKAWSIPEGSSSSWRSPWYFPREPNLGIIYSDALTRQAGHYLSQPCRRVDSSRIHVLFLATPWLTSRHDGRGIGDRPPWPWKVPPDLSTPPDSSTCAHLPLITTQVRPIRKLSPKVKWFGVHFHQEVQELSLREVLYFVRALR